MAESEWECKDLASSRAYARAMTTEDARKAIDNLVWSWGEGSPDGEELTDQGRLLVAIGVEHPTLLPELVALLRDKPPLRAEISHVLATISRERPGIGELALKALAKHGSGAQLINAAFEHVSTAKIGPWSATSTATDVEAPCFWLVILKALANRGESLAVDALVRLLQDPNRDVRFVTVMVLVVVAGEEPRIIAALCSAATTDPDPDVRAWAASRIAWLQPCSPELAGQVVPVLTDALKARSLDTQRVAAYSLGKLGDLALDALSHLRKREEAVSKSILRLEGRCRKAEEKARDLRERLQEESSLNQVIEEAIRQIRPSGEGGGTVADGGGGR